jgi:Flp pilus assembly protein TadD
MARLILAGIFAVFLLFIAACTPSTPTPPPITPSATLRGAFVPTRVSPTPSDTPTSTPSATPTPTETASPTPSPTLTPTVDPTQIASLIEDGAAFSDAGRYDRAIEAFSQAIALDSNSVNALFGRGTSYFDSEQYELAIEDFNRVIDLDSSNEPAYFNRGLAYLNLEDYERAIENFNQSIELDPAYGPTYYLRGVAYYELGDLDRALEDADQAIDLLPSDAVSYQLRADINYDQGNLEDALPDYRTYARLLGSEAEAEVLARITELEDELGTPVPEGSPTSVVSNTGDVIDLTIGGPAQSGQIGEDVPTLRYAFEAQAGDIVTINMNVVSGDLDPLLILLGPNGGEIARNDDAEGGTSRDSLLNGITIPDSGTYTIMATRFQEALGTTEGTFTLTLTGTGGGVVVTPPPTGELLEYDSEVEGVIEGEEGVVEYQFEAQRGDVVNIRMNALSGDLDPLLILLGPGGREIARNDDDPQRERDSYLEGVILPVDGIYTIHATRFQEDLGSTSGTFNLELHLITPGVGQNVTPLPVGGDVIALNEVVEGNITDEEFRVMYRIELRADSLINIRMDVTDGDLDPLVILLDPRGQEIARNDDDEQRGGPNAFLRRFRVLADGVYTVVATRFQEDLGSTTGDFELEVRLAPGQ